MANFSEHINHSKSNLDYLSKINSHINDRWDWQVTVCFYAALHLINAHIVDKTKKNYLSHNKVSEIISPYNQFSLAKLDEETYLSYNKLFQLSRRSRYLLNEDFGKKRIIDIQPASLTYGKHFRKAIYHLDKIIIFMSKNYDISFERLEVSCVDLKKEAYTNFHVI